ncbi:MAG: hypothetical protein GEU96_20380 [Propionibacteriales bacterium]|nr:hypothetical protein [Propionibacteriales bacterium]
MSHHQVVLVRPWTDARGGTGCCGGEPSSGICLEHRVGGEHGPDADALAVAHAYRRLREQVDDVDVQIVGANNTVFLLPAVFRAARRRVGTLAALGSAVRATTAGAVLVDGSRVGDIAALGPDGVVAAVCRATGR